MPENTIEYTPADIAENYLRAILRRNTRQRIEWECRIPSVRYPYGHRWEWLGRFVDIAYTAAGNPGYAHLTRAEECGWLLSCLVQDDAAMAMGMGEDQRVTCAEHAQWATPEHRATHCAS